VIEEEKLAQRAAKVGKDMLTRLQKFAEGKKHIGEVRGLGMMIAIEFNDEKGNPSKEWADKVAAKCTENKLLVLTCGSHSQVIRLIPPLNISDADAQKGLDILEKCMTA